MNKKSRIIGAAGLLLAVITLACTLPARAQQIVAGPIDTSQWSGVTNGTMTSVSNAPHRLPQKSDLVGIVDEAVTLGTNYSTYYFNLGVTNHWTTTYPISLTVTGTSGAGTTNSTPFYIARTNFVGFDSIRCDKIVSVVTNGGTASAGLIGSHPPD